MLNKIKEIKNKKSIYEDEDGYKYLYSNKSIGNILYRKSDPNKFFRNKFTRYNMINYLKINKSDFMLLSNISEVNNANSHTKLLFSCYKHGDFYMDWNSITNSKGCNICGSNKKGANKRNSIDTIRNKCKDRGLLLLSENYGNNSHVLKLKCMAHNNIIFTSYQNIITNTHNCGECLLESKKNSGKINFYNKLEKSNISNPKIISYNGRNKSYVVAKCCKCGYEWEIKKSHFFDGSGCPICATKSKGEDKISEILTAKNISFTRQKRYADCKNKRVLPFDFYLDDYDILIEYDGRQHYVGYSAFGGNDTLKKTQFHDSIKNKYCKDNNIILIRIPYWDFGNIEKILNKII